MDINIYFVSFSLSLETRKKNWLDWFTLSGSLLNRDDKCWKPVPNFSFGVIKSLYNFFPSFFFRLVSARRESEGNPAISGARVRPLTFWLNTFRLHIDDYHISQCALIARPHKKKTRTIALYIVCCKFFVTWYKAVDWEVGKSCALVSSDQNKSAETRGTFWAVATRRREEKEWQCRLQSKERKNERGGGGQNRKTTPETTRRNGHQRNRFFYSIARKGQSDGSFI